MNFFTKPSDQRERIEANRAVARTGRGPAALIGYNTNGLAHHDLFDAVELLADIGYLGVAVTIDHGALPPGEPELPRHIARLRDLLEKRGMRSVIETGARFLLDPRKKHEPTLVSPSPKRRIEFYRHAIDCAEQLGSDCVSIWSGTCADELAASDAMAHLVAGLRETLAYANERRVTIAFEPEPGMFIDTTAGYEMLLPLLGEYSETLRLTLDIGHLHCQGEPIPETIRRWAPRLANVHIEDMRRGRHEHLMFGEGEIDFPPVLQALRDAGYTGGVYVELSRHSHEGPAAARKAFEFLRPLVSE